MSITPDEVRRLAALAQLALTEEEVGALARDLGSVLEHMDVLAAVDPPTAELPARSQQDVPPLLRPDQPGADSLLYAPAELAPAWRESFYLVPRLTALGPEDPTR